MTHPLYTNRLVHEKSPYLLQHAHNPVDWFPWSEEAFTVAKAQDKPVFLSIGYATCHWCHVMEQESFENVEIAELLNKTFINIKVDREEKPDVDSLYMEFAQAMMSGGAGWPLNIILTPDLMPFFAATYLPSEGMKGFLGMKQLILRIQQIWEDPEERENVISQAGKIVDVFANHTRVEGEYLPSKEKITEAAEILFKTADPIYGGTKGAPKFPIGFQGCFLLRFAKQHGDSRALFYAERTLEMMYRGGIYDHIGGGFSRYSVDEKWFIPHFEKMLYDNAILSRAYLETWQYTKQPFYKEISESILSYVLRTLRDPQGGFYSAEDADTQGHEGLFYTWKQNEIEDVLGIDAPFFSDFYGVTARGNFEGRNILHIPVGQNEYAHQHHLNPQELSIRLKLLNQKLFEQREKRERPLIDDKIITSWNGLMIYSLAEAGFILGNDQYLKYAESAARFCKQHLWKEGNLLRRYRDNDSRFDGCLDDYAFLIQGLLSLFEANYGSEWLEFALDLTKVLSADFQISGGAFYLTNGRDPHLILRRCEFYDGAEPSGNAIQAENLIRLYQITGHKEFLKQAEDVLKAAKEHIDIYPPGACYHLMALQRLLDLEAPTFIIALNEKEDLEKEIGQLLAQNFIPHKVIIWRRDSDEVLRDLSYICRDKGPVQGKTTLYICTQKACSEPFTDLDAMKAAIEKIR